MTDGAALDPERWRRIDALFEATLEKSPEERQAFLARLEPGLRQEVERLLAADEAARTFLEDHAGGWLSAAAAAPPPAAAQTTAEATAEATAKPELPKRIGPYKVLGVIGEGGMGRVLLAARADEQYQRLVAIKTLRARAGAGRTRDAVRREAPRRQELLARFDLERQALAQLEHPNIARLYDAGRDENGDPYLVLEHIDGVPIDTYCDEQCLDVAARLRLFLEVCQAVQAAHRNLLVHRDLKPSNILVTREGRPMLLDFGIAKLLDPGRAAGLGREVFETSEGSRPMTPGYASPEQVKGEPITTASDVYSLGVLLYELLTGRKPYRVTSWAPHELEKAICEVEPEKPSTAVFRETPPNERRGAGEGLAPAEVARRRSTSPGALARHLRGDLDTLLSTALRKDPDRRYASVEALAQDIAAYLEGKPLRARRSGRLYALRKFVLRHRLGVAAAAALAALLLFFVGALIIQDGRIRAERDKAQQALAFLIEVFKASDPTRAQGAEPKARDILDGAAQRVKFELASQPEIQATLMDAMGQVYHSLGLYEEARGLFAEALARRIAELGEKDPETLLTRGRLGRALGRLSQWPEARLELERAIAGRDPEAPEDAELAQQLDDLADVELYFDHRGATLERRRQAAAILERIGAPYPKRLAAKAKLVHAHLDAQQFAELDTLMADLLRESSGLIDGPTGSDSLETAATLLEVANELWEFGDDRAEPLFRRAIEIRRKWLDPAHPDLVQALRRLGFVFYFEERFDESLQINQETWDVLLPRIGPDDPRILGIENNLAASLSRVGRPAEALPRIRHVREQLERNPDIAVPRIANVYLTEGGIHGQLGDFPAAERCFTQARRIFEKGGDPTNDRALLEMSYAELRRIQKNPEAAREHFARALEIRRARVGETDWSYTYLRGEYAEILTELGRFSEAEKEAQASYDSLRATYGPRTVMVEKPLKSLLALYRQQGREADAARIRAAIDQVAGRPAKLGS